MVAQSSLAVLAGAMLTRWLAEQSIHDQSNALRLSRGDGVPQPIALEDHHTSLRRLHRLALKVQQALGVVTHHIDHSQPPPLERVAVEMRADAIARTLPVYELDGSIMAAGALGTDFRGAAAHADASADEDDSGDDDDA